MQSVILIALLVCAVSAQYNNQQYQQQPQQQQQQTTRFNQYSSSAYGQPQYNQQQGYNSQYGQYGTTTPNYNNRMYDPSTQRFYNGVSMTSALTALSAAAIALVL